MADESTEPQPAIDPLQRNRVPPCMTGAEFRCVAEVINESCNDVIRAVRELQQAVHQQFTEHDAALRGEIVGLRCLAESILKGEEHDG